jgi:hypothetical protein
MDKQPDGIDVVFMRLVRHGAQLRDWAPGREQKRHECHAADMQIQHGRAEQVRCDRQAATDRSNNKRPSTGHAYHEELPEANLVHERTPFRVLSWAGRPGIALR